jgi:hypothetical protein
MQSQNYFKYCISLKKSQGELVEPGVPLYSPPSIPTKVGTDIILKQKIFN